MQQSDIGQDSDRDVFQVLGAAPQPADCQRGSAQRGMQLPSPSSVQQSAAFPRPAAPGFPKGNGCYTSHKHTYTMCTRAVFADWLSLS